MRCSKGKAYELRWVSSSGWPKDGARKGELIRKERRVKELRSFSVREILILEGETITQLFCYDM